MPIGGEWKKSTRSSGNGSCVEVRLSAGVVRVRDTKLGAASPILGVAADRWAEFSAAVAAGEHDRH